MAIRRKSQRFRCKRRRDTAPIKRGREAIKGGGGDPALVNSALLSAASPHNAVARVGARDTSAHNVRMQRRRRGTAGGRCDAALVVFRILIRQADEGRVTVARSSRATCRFGGFAR
jgi:hypothetical protein